MYQVFLQSSNKNVRSAERFSALHFMNQTVNMKRKGNCCAMFRRLRRNANAQLFTKPVSYTHLDVYKRQLINKVKSKCCGIKVYYIFEDTFFYKLCFLIFLSCIIRALYMVIFSFPQSKKFLHLLGT